ncbi:hypothetical protein J6590_048626 [Homalodisca vitripennis]|nr:hypothetical protein J6590_048626 [Homalodisca vitripennis]
MVKCVVDIAIELYPGAAEKTFGVQPIVEQCVVDIGIELYPGTAEKTFGVRPIVAQCVVDIAIELYPGAAEKTVGPANSGAVRRRYCHRTIPGCREKTFWCPANSGAVRRRYCHRTIPGCSREDVVGWCVCVGWGGGWCGVVCLCWWWGFGVRPIVARCVVAVDISSRSWQ